MSPYVALKVFGYQDLGSQAKGETVLRFCNTASQAELLNKAANTGQKTTYEQMDVPIQEGGIENAKEGNTQKQSR